MDWLKHLIDIVLHLDVHLKQFVADHGAWTYVVLFCDRVLRNWLGGAAVSARRFAAVHRGGDRR